mmetsp:Transcript_9006/g.19993  ORF Transcript_9006/g.19993 Transcript_9006/m.19993 type:complete len:262 (+) Transcript_9006:1321-2106(+)
MDVRRVGQIVSSWAGTLPLPRHLCHQSFCLCRGGALVAVHQLPLCLVSVQGGGKGVSARFGIALCGLGRSLKIVGNFPSIQTTATFWTEWFHGFIALGDLVLSRTRKQFGSPYFVHDVFADTCVLRELATYLSRSGGVVGDAICTWIWPWVVIEGLRVISRGIPIHPASLGKNEVPLADVTSWPGDIGLRFGDIDEGRRVLGVGDQPAHLGLLQVLRVRICRMVCCRIWDIVGSPNLIFHGQGLVGESPGLRGSRTCHRKG